MTGIINKKENMTLESTEPLWALTGILFKSHPWHGVLIGHDAPDVVTAYIEIVPTDTIKYELDKTTGLLKVDRPQRFSNVCPTLYGLIPQTYCGERIGKLCSDRTGRTGLTGDGDPLDICVLTEKVISHGDILLEAIPIGGLRMIDGQEADDKILAVMQGDGVYGAWTDIGECPDSLIQRLQHYFLTYKTSPDAPEPHCEITHLFGRKEAHEIIKLAHEDYLAEFPDIKAIHVAALKYREEVA